MKKSIGEELSEILKIEGRNQYADNIAAIANDAVPQQHRKVASVASFIGGIVAMRLTNDRDTKKIISRVSTTISRTLWDDKK